MSGWWVFAWAAWAADAAGGAPEPLDLNLASIEALRSVPGLGPTKADAIVRDRIARGPFKKVEQLERVSGIGPATVAKLAPYLVVGDWKASREAIAAERERGLPPPGPVVDINTASWTEIEALPGIGANKAMEIVADRDKRGPYRSCRSLERVEGIGPSTVDRLLPQCEASREERRP